MKASLDFSAQSPIERIRAGDELRNRRRICQLTQSAHGVYVLIRVDDAALVGA